MREFNYKGHLVRVIPVGNTPWLALADICKVLQLGSATKVAANIAESDKRFELIRNRRSAQKMIVINENGFHAVIAHSRNTEAKEFENWIDCNVFSEPEQQMAKSELQVFENEEMGTQLRGLMIDGEPWFVAADVCEALEIQNTTQAVSKLDEDEKSMLNIGLPGGASNCVNEYGLYNLILGSRKPEAKVFKRWVTHEVLPSIRKTGKYETTAKPQVQPSVEAGIQKVGLLVRIAEHKVVPQNEQLRLLNMAVRELTGTELNLVVAKNKIIDSNSIHILNGIQSMNRKLMDLPEIFGFVSKAKIQKIGKNTFYFYPVTDIASRIGISPAKFNQFADAHGLKQGCNGVWEVVNTPQGEAREFMYLQSAVTQYFEEAK